MLDRYSKPNNEYLSDYDKNKDSSYLMYLDANNIYDMLWVSPCQLVGVNG